LRPKDWRRGWALSKQQTLQVPQRRVPASYRTSYTKGELVICQVSLQPLVDKALTLRKAAATAGEQKKQPMQACQMSNFSCLFPNPFDASFLKIIMQPPLT